MLYYAVQVMVACLVACSLNQARGMEVPGARGIGTGEQKAASHNKRERWVGTRLFTNFLQLADWLICLSRIHQAGMVCLIYLSRIDPAGMKCLIWLRRIVEHAQKNKTHLLA